MPLFLTTRCWVLALGSLVVACSFPERTVAPTGDNEAITTVMLTLTNQADSTDIRTALIDNLGSNRPDFSRDTLRLKPNTAYKAKIGLVNKLTDPFTDATVEISQLANEHLLVYTPTVGLNLAVIITDRDTNPSPGPYPIGLASIFTTGNVSTGKLNVVLRHQPETKNGTPTPGTSDLDTNFDVVIR